MLRANISLQLVAKLLSKMSVKIFQLLLCLTVLNKCYAQFYDNTPLYSISANTFREFNLYEIKNVSLSNCQIHTVDRSTFNQMVRLQEIRMDHNDITSLDVTIFDNNPKLEKVNLAWNKLNNLPVNIFGKLRNLKELWLYKNNIKQFHPDIFAPLNSLKKLVIYANQLTEIKNNIFRNNYNLEYLHFGDNTIVNLPEDLFNNLPKLNSLMLHRNKLQNFPTRIFGKLYELQNLSIAYNEITDLDPQIFDNNRKLSNIWMGGNKITTLRSGLFKNAPDLKFLNIQNNKIRTFEPIFAPNCKITKLQMFGNELTTLQPSIITNLRDLKILELHNNPWNCDCSIRDLFTKWKTLNTLPPICSSPDKNKNKNWLILSENDFVCTDKYTVEESSSKIDGNEATITCKSKSNKIEPITWQFNNQNIETTNIPYQTCYSHTSDGKTQYNLLIKNLDPSVSGKYKCIIGNNIEKAEKEETLNITPNLIQNLARPSLSVFLSKELFINADFGEKVTASCQIYARANKPDASKLFWIFNGQTLTSSGSRYKFDYFEVDDRLTWYNMTINSVKDSDGGVYSCKTNDFADVSSFKLKVNKKLNTNKQTWVDFE